MTAGPPARVVLDTNVLVSLFVFADSRLALLRRRLDQGAWLALTDERCLAEFRRVLAYPMFGLDDAGRLAAYEAYAQVACRLAERPATSLPLPQCPDPDDQKFLELARDGAAKLLVTSDKALLKLARHGRLRNMFAIVTPEVAVAP